MSKRQSDERKLLEHLGPAFAKAFGIFASELTARDRHRAHEQTGEILHSLVENETDPRVAEKLRRARKALAATEPVVLTDDSPAEAAAHRLQRAAKERGITQSEIARKLGVTPAVIHRVFQDPNRSKVKTLRKIAAAMGVSLREIIE